MKAIAICTILFCTLNHVLGQRTMTFTNNCGYDIWISPTTNDNGPTLQPGLSLVSDQNTFTYNIPDEGWKGRVWPKSGCDDSGNNCQVGQSVDPCGPDGCDPPSDTKVEFNFPAVWDSNAQVWYDISLVDGYSIPTEIVPSQEDGNSCVRTNCAVSMDSCPTNENDVGDLRVMKDGNPVMCLSPCKRWNYPSPYGMGQPETKEPGQHYCCPTPPISPDDCRNGPMVNTNYVNLIHQVCPSAYSYAYDDEAGLHNCPNNVNFDITYCPSSN